MTNDAYEYSTTTLEEWLDAIKGPKTYGGPWYWHLPTAERDSAIAILEGSMRAVGLSAVRGCAANQIFLSLDKLPLSVVEELYGYLKGLAQQETTGSD